MLIICNYSINIVQWLVELYVIKMHGTGVKMVELLFIMGRRRDKFIPICRKLLLKIHTKVKVQI